MRRTYALAILIILVAFTLSGCAGTSFISQPTPTSPPPTPTPPAPPTPTPPPPPPTPTPVPTNFSNATLSGSFVVTANGTNSGGPYTLLSVLAADGNGNITSGHTFYNAARLSFGNFSATGTYSVKSDGRTTINLTADFLNTVTFDVVLLSAQHGLVVRVDNAATASGSLDKQDASAFNPADIAGTWVFNVQGTDKAGLPEASVGMFTIDSNSNITGGVQDTNDNGGITANSPVLPGPTSVFDVVPVTGQGVFAYTTDPEGLRSYGLVAIDANHIKFASNESIIIQSGDLYRVAPTVISGSLAFALKGVTANGAFAAGGILATDGAGNILGSSVEDINNAGTLSLNTALSGIYSSSGSRATLH